MRSDVTIHCPSCQGSASRIGQLQDCEWFAGKRLDQPLPGGSLFRCPRCHLKFRSPPLRPENYERLYDNALTTAWASRERPDWERVIARIRSAFPDGAKILDYGCYTGGLLSRFDEKFERFGIEINGAAATVAARTHGVKVWATLAEVPAGTKFDAIVVADVIEHVIDPAVLTANLLRLLAEGGILVLSTGDAESKMWNLFRANWWYCFHLEHVAFISKRWLHQFARDHDCELVAVETFRYSNPSARRLLTDWPLTILYGTAPNVYVTLGRLWKAATATKGVVAVRGVGLTKDHLFAVLRPRH